ADDDRVSASRVPADALAAARARARGRGLAGALIGTRVAAVGRRRKRAAGRPLGPLSAKGAAPPIRSAGPDFRLAALRELHAAPTGGAALVQGDNGLAKLGFDDAAGALSVAGDRVRALRDAIAIPAAALATGRRRAFLHGHQLVRLVVRRPPPHSIDTTRMSNVRLLPAS